MVLPAVRVSSNRTELGRHMRRSPESYNWLASPAEHNQLTSGGHRSRVETSVTVQAGRELSASEELAKYSDCPQRKGLAGSTDPKIRLARGVSEVSNLHCRVKSEVSMVVGPGPSCTLEPAS